ncbi:NAF1-domain-containing protein [Aspergillus campestris IBT 28561]|uniref:H/ACA ribonucleoprotein complex non-core subunit NAF1 n=1 Tax=Aspergillus campestris (strain IBT 28561) TaxID=1392248 RepID=A0A2I1DGF6_ASPC2|nr:NAF1-domain-containing protein [Aspergillus campestris IBT 28561]PKY08953.1 NAF1-domain-containing protein [Aspergillus campestris IBT 28561]
MAGTPVPATEVQQNIAQEKRDELNSSNPSAPIPGLGLVKNDSDQTVSNDSGPSQTVNATEGVVREKQVVTTTESTGENADNTQAMDVQQDGDQTKPKDAIETTNDTNAPDAMEVADGEGEGEPREWETDSSPYESSSDDSSDSSDDDSDDSDDDYPILTAEETARILMQAELGSDDEGDGKGKSGGQLRTANEVPDEAPPLPEITITPEMKVVFLGQVEAIVENTLLIAANTSGEYQVLESGSILCLEDRKLAGVVSETLGRVENPLYAVRYPDAAAITERGISKGTNIYYVEEKSTFVFTQPLKGLKGSDASNFHDEEIPEDEVEFSDDEAEAEFKKRQKQKRQEKKGAKEGGRAQRGPPGPSKLARTELNYDDNAGDEGYTPLARPKNLHEMMGPQEAPVEKDGPPGVTPAFRGGRGRGRGSDRGRGAGRGRGRGGSYNNDRQPSHQHHGSHSPSQPTNYQQQPYPQNPQNPYPMNQQQFPSFPYFPQQQQQQQPQQQQQQQPQPQQPFAQGQMPAPFNFQMPFQQAFQQPNPYQQMPHINPMFLAALQQQQQQQQQHQAYQQPQQPGQPQAQSPLNFDQVKAQLDLLRHLSNNNNNQGPPPS